MASGILLTLAFPPLGWWPVAWVALAPWYVRLSGRPHPPASEEPPKPGGEGLLSGFLFGLALFLVGMVWMTEIGTVPWVVLSLIQAVPFALLGLVCTVLLPRVPPWARPWVFAALWALLEGARTWGRFAFPWFLLAATQVRALPLVQVASVTGQWGVSFAVAAVGGLLGEAWRQRDDRRSAARFAALAALVPLALGGAGAVAMRAAPGSGAVRSAAIVQGSIPKPSGTYSAEERQETLRTYVGLTMEAGKERPALIAWPETVVPGRLLRDPYLLNAVSFLARNTRTPLLVGSVDVDEQSRFWNTAILIGPDGVVAGRYDKTQLVPVGEFFPLRRFLGPIYAQYNVPSQDFNFGSSSGVLETGASPDRAARVGALICYESAFPKLAARRVRDGAGFLVLLTSDQTFGTTAGPYQHADLSVLRAVETRRWLVRAAATGISEIVDPWGRVHERLGINKRGVVAGDLRLRSDRTPFVRWGDWFLWVCGAVVVGAVFAARGGLRPPVASHAHAPPAALPEDEHR